MTNKMTPQEFVDEANSLMKNTEAEKAAVDEGVQAALPKDARWHRREARRLLWGKKGMADEQKIERLERAYDHLAEAIHLMKTGEEMEEDEA